jgi:hypothetical protein
LALVGARGATFGRGFLTVVPAAECLEVAVIVGAAAAVRGNVVDLISRSAALDPAGIAGLTAVSVASENADADELPVWRKLVATL